MIPSPPQAQCEAHGGQEPRLSCLCTVFLSSTVSATLQGLRTCLLGTNEEIDVQPMEGSSYNSGTLLSQVE